MHLCSIKDTFYLKNPTSSVIEKCFSIPKISWAVGKARISNCLWKKEPRPPRSILLYIVIIMTDLPLKYAGLSSCFLNHKAELWTGNLWVSDLLSKGKIRALKKWQKRRDWDGAGRERERKEGRKRLFISYTSTVVMNLFCLKWRKERLSCQEIRWCKS